MSSLFGNDDVKQARAQAQKTAQESRELQAVMNDRQLADQNRANREMGLSRRAPRGRRLFVDGKQNLS